MPLSLNSECINSEFVSADTFERRDKYQSETSGDKKDESPFSHLRCCGYACTFQRSLTVYKKISIIFLYISANKYEKIYLQKILILNFKNTWSKVHSKKISEVWNLTLKFYLKVNITILQLKIPYSHIAWFNNCLQQIRINSRSSVTASPSRSILTYFSCHTSY